MSKTNTLIRLLADKEIQIISLHEPWATALVYGIKKNETRSWRTKVRGIIAIHAAKTKLTPSTTFTEDISYLSIEGSEINNLLYFKKMRISCTYGAIVGFVKIVDCVPAESIRDQMSTRELALGDYSNGRWVWICEDHIFLETPIPAKGKQGFFKWKP